jgi:hypothetical protein
LRDTKAVLKFWNKRFKFFEYNGHKIKKDNLGGDKSVKSKEFNKDLNRIKSDFAEIYSKRQAFIKYKIEASAKIDALIKETGNPRWHMLTLYEKVY